MDSDQITRILRNNYITDSTFKGVFASDELPILAEKGVSSVYVCNTDPHNEPGEHWVVIYTDGNGYGEYFDSFGRSPRHVNFKQFLKMNCKRIECNRKIVQSIFSTVCGCYCIFYCVYRCLGYNIMEIADMFTSNSDFNDEIVVDFTYNMAACV